MITVLIGHRGTGKTALLRRIASVRPDAVVHDLDECIEQGEAKSIHEIFRAYGEDAFRGLEREYLARLAARHDGGEDAFIALGAGFPGPLPPGVHCLWVRRDTDRDGRIFLDRPRLDPEVDPLEEYMRRFEEREPRFRDWADDVITVGEGFVDADPGEARFLAGRDGTGDAAITLLPEHVRQNAAGRGRLTAWAKRQQALGVTTFELRDDLLSPGQLRAALETLPVERLLFSFRKPHPARPEPWPAQLRFDWDLSLERCPFGKPSILSLHARAEGETTVAQAGRRLETAATGGEWLKLAVEVRDFEELMAGHRWAMRDPKKRAFLPCSDDGRWSWYRLTHGRRYPLAFVREGTGSAPDQPTEVAWLRQGRPAEHFAAVLGDPVAHSWTPAVHHEFFARRGMPVVAVRVTEADWDAGALETLATLGLRYAAVTAPLKALAFRAAAVAGAEAVELGAVNTLHRPAAGGWRGTNTDLDGLRAALASLDLTGPVAVWGGGGMRPVLLACLQRATFFAARSGRRTAGPQLSRPRTVVWAAGSRATRPPASWRPEQIVDLDYRDNAAARAWAAEIGAKYVAGTTLFREQAQRQRAWWESAEKTV